MVAFDGMGNSGFDDELKIIVKNLVFRFYHV